MVNDFTILFHLLQSKVKRILKERWTNLSKDEKKVWKKWEGWDAKRYRRDVILFERNKSKEKDVSNKRKESEPSYSKPIGQQNPDLGKQKEECLEKQQEKKTGGGQKKCKKSKSHNNIEEEDGAIGPDGNFAEFQDYNGVDNPVIARKHFLYSAMQKREK